VAVFLDSWQAITLSTTSAWETVDLSVSPYSLPANAVGIMALIRNTNVSQFNAGWRMYGSTDDRKHGVTNGAQVAFNIGINVDRKVDLYVGYANMTFLLMGYYTDDETVFFTNGYDKSPSPANGWRDINCSGEVPAGATAAFVDFSQPGSAQSGVRQKGSTDTYRVFVVGKCAAIVGLDIDRHYEANTSSTTNGKMWLVGYMKTGTFKTNELDKTPTGALGTYWPVNLLSDLPASGTTGVIIHWCPTTSAGYGHCARKMGSSNDSYYVANLHGWWPIAISALGVIEAKLASANLKLQIVGYFQAPASPTKNQVRTATSDTYAGAWVPSVGSDLYAVIDEEYPFSDSDYMSTVADTGATFGFSAFTLPAGATVNSVSARIRAKSTLGALDDWIDVFLNMGTSDSEGAQLTSAWAYYTLVWSLDPNTGLPWTRAGVNALTAMDISATFGTPAGNEIFVSGVDLIVNYSEAGSGPITEEGSVVIHSVVSGYNDGYEAREVVIQAQVQAWDNWEVRGVTVQAVVRGELNEEGRVLIKAEVGREYIRHLLDTGSVTARAILRAVTATPTPPRVKGRKPSPGETVVLRNQPVAFYIAGQGVDQVDINTVKVTINGVEYTKASPNFIYSGFGDLYYVEVWHLDWGYVQTANVRIDARSVLNQVMAPVTYSFQTVWEDPYTRSGWPRLELYYPGAYDLPALTIQENYVRQGIERYTAELELWYGRYQKLPYVEDVELRILPGATNAVGKEVADNGWLGVRVGPTGGYAPLTPAAVVHLGPMYTHTHKSLFFKLLVPGGALTKRYFVLELSFKPKLFRPWGRFLYGKGFYNSSEVLENFHPSKAYYRVFVFDDAMWRDFEESADPGRGGRGEDKQW
jgi:hypothetical protein